MKTELHFVFEDDPPKQRFDGREFINLLADNQILSKEWAGLHCNKPNTKYSATLDIFLMEQEEPVDDLNQDGN